jgi:hypothetical protein
MQNVMVLFLQGILEFFPVSSSTILSIFFNLNAQKIILVHFYSAIAGIFFFREELISIFRNKTKLLFYLSSVFGFLSTCLLLPLIFLMKNHLSLLNFHSSSKVMLFKCLTNILQGLVLFFILNRNWNISQTFNYNNRNGFLIGACILLSMFLGTSRLGSFLIILIGFGNSIEKSFNISILISSVFGFCAVIGSFLLSLIKNKTFKSLIKNNQTINKLEIFSIKNGIELIIIFLISYIVLFSMENYKRECLYWSNIVKVSFYSYFLLKFLKFFDLFKKILNSILEFFPEKYKAWIFLLVGIIIENTPILLVGISYAVNYSIISNFKIFLFISLCSTVFDIGLFFVLKYFFSDYLKRKIHESKFLQSFMNKESSKLMFGSLMVFYRFIPLMRIPVLGICSVEFSLLINIILNFVGSILWSAFWVYIIYSSYIQNLISILFN